MQNDAIMIPRPENPAKAFLRRYRALVIRQESLQRAIDAAYDRAYSCTSRLKPVHVQGGGTIYDRIAEDVARISDETEKLLEAREQANAALTEILEAIGAVQDETQKAVLTLRYVEGLEWPDVQEKLGYERTQAYVIHGWALQVVKRWMIDRGMI